MTRELRWLLLFTPVMLAALACETVKSSNPLSPLVAGPIAGVNITAPTPVEPNATKLAVDKQPVSLIIQNSVTSGQRPLSYVFEVATDVNFATKVFERTGIPPGDGRTTVRLPDPLATGRSYYWRARAEDGANVGPYSSPANFDVVTPIVIERPSLVSPAHNARVTSLRPTFVFNNASRSGPAVPIEYVIEISDTDSFASKLALWTVGESPGNQTTTQMPQDGQYSVYLFWHVRASDPTTAGPWSDVQGFSMPEPPPMPVPPPVPVPAPPGGGGGGNPGLHVPPGPLTEDRAHQVIDAAAREFPHLIAVFNSEDDAVRAADELLLRIIWHMQLAGFQAARQRNPSGAISSDKLTIVINGGWHVYDIMSLGFGGRATTMQMIEIGGANPVADAGIPD